MKQHFSSKEKTHISTQNWHRSIHNSKILIKIPFHEHSTILKRYAVSHCALVLLSSSGNINFEKHTAKAIYFWFRTKIFHKWLSIKRKKLDLWGENSKWEKYLNTQPADFCEKCWIWCGQTIFDFDVFVHTSPELSIKCTLETKIKSPGHCGEPFHQCANVKPWWWCCFVKVEWMFTNSRMMGKSKYWNSKCNYVT